MACDVGQGDAILIYYGQKRILIDTGPNLDVLECLPRVAFGAGKAIDVVVLTHWDKDHIGGFASVLQKYKVGMVITNTPTKTTESVANLVDLIEKSGGSLEPVVGESLLYPGLRLRFLWNHSMLSLDTRGKPESEENASSIGVQLTGKGFGFLSLGDLECNQELAVLTLPLLNPYQILKVSHHGAKTSSCLRFLEKSRPEVALISSGAGNSYGHPAAQTLDSLRKNGIFVLRTDLLGDIFLTKKEGGWQLKSSSKRGSAAPAR